MIAWWRLGSAMRILTALVTLALIVGCALREVPITNGVQNFGKVNDSLYRGSQPDEKAMRQLHALGIRSVINLRMTKDVWKEESEAAAAYSMAYTNIPLETLSAPTDAQVASVLAAISIMPKPVFIHCRYGCDRTGTIIGCYRIQQDHWDNSVALKEAEVYGISPFEVGMRSYIKRFMR
jgi:tyrosine-protein phosphatase SIW14